MCGAERTGVAFAPRDALPRRHLVPHARAPRRARSCSSGLHGLVGSVGARPVAIDAGVHDRLMALVSHLPHVLAGALVNQAAGTAPEGREALRSAGPSFGDLTRVAGSNPPLWADILLANRDGGARGPAASYAGRLGEVEAALRRGDRDWLLAFVGRRGRRPRPPARGRATPARPSRRAWWWRSRTGLA